MYRLNGAGKTPPKDLDSCIRMINEDLSAFDQALWLNGPLPNDYETIEKHLGQIDNFLQTAKQLDNVIQKLCEEDMLVRSITKATASPKPVDSLNQKMSSLRTAVKDRQDRLKKLAEDFRAFQVAINQQRGRLLETEGHLAGLGDDPFKLDLLYQQFDLHFETMEVIGKMAEKFAGPSLKQFSDLKGHFSELLQKASDSHVSLKARLAGRHWKSDLKRQLPDVLEKLAEIDAHLVSPRFAIKPNMIEATEQSLQFKRFVEHDVEPVLQVAAQLVELLPDDEGEASFFNQQRSDVSKRMTAIRLEIDKRRNLFERVLKLIENYEILYKAFDEWLLEKERSLRQVSCSSFRRILDELTAFDERLVEIKEKAVDLRKLLEAGTSLEFSLSRPDAVSLRRQLTEVHGRWKAVKDGTTIAMSKLSNENKLANLFFSQLKDLHEWIGNTSKKLASSQQESWDSRGTVQIMLYRLNHIGGAIRTKEKTYQGFLERSADLKAQLCHDDLDSLEFQSKVDELKNAWIGLLASVDERRRRLESVLVTLGEFTETPETLAKWLSQTKLLLDVNLPTYGDLATVDKLLKDHRSLEEMLNRRSDTIDNLREATFSANSTVSLLSGFDLDAALPAGGSSMSLFDGEVAGDLDDLTKQVRQSAERRSSSLQQSREMAVKFEKLQKSLNLWFDDLRNRCQNAGQTLATLGLNNSRSLLNKQLEKVQQWIQESEIKRSDYNEVLIMGQQILEHCHPDAVLSMKRNLMALKARWSEIVQNSLHGLKNWIEESISRLDNDLSKLADVTTWLEEVLPLLKASKLNSAVLLKCDNEALEQKLNEQVQLEEQMAQQLVAYQRLPTQFQARIEASWSQLVQVLNERHRLLHEATEQRRLAEQLRSFNFEEWRKRYVAWLSEKKFRLLDAFRTLDTDRDGKLSRKDLIDGILRSRFSNNSAELHLAAAHFFEGNVTKLSYGDYQRKLQPAVSQNQTDQILAEVNQYLMECRCKIPFKIQRTMDGRFRMGQQIVAVRVISSTLHVRVGGGWQPLDEFVRRNDPCRHGKLTRPSPQMPPKVVQARPVTYSSASRKTK